VPTVITINSSGSNSGGQIVVTKQSGGMVTQTTYNVDGNGTVQSIAQGSSSGSVSVGSGGSGSVAGNPGVSDPGGGGGLAPSGFPSDYATSGNQQLGNMLLTDINDKLARIADAVEEDEEDVYLDDPTLDNAMPGFGDTFDSLIGFSLPPHASECPTGSFEFAGSVYVLDSHCQLILDQWGLLQSAMAVVWVLAALFIVLRA
jgi:hypothetical protein